MFIHPRAKHLSQDLNYNPDCYFVQQNLWIDPSVLDGHWDDRTTQVFLSTMTHGLRSVPVQGLPRTKSNRQPRNHTVVDESLPLFQSIWENDHDGGIAQAQDEPDLYAEFNAPTNPPLGEDTAEDNGESTRSLRF